MENSGSRVVVGTALDKDFESLARGLTEKYIEISDDYFLK